MSSKSKTEIAKELLNDLPELVQNDAPGSSLANEPGPEDLLDDGREEESPGEPAFTESDIKDFDRLDNEVNKACRRTFEALREIRQRKLYRIPKDERGNKLFPTFDDYVEQRHGHDRTWVTKGTNWLRILEALKKLGIRVNLGLKAAQALTPYRVNAAGGLRAIFVEAQRENLPLTYDSLRAIVERRYKYFGDKNSAAPTYEQYRQDLETVASLKGQSYRIMRDAEELPGDLAENLVKLCQEERKIPVNEHLLGSFTGQALKDVVDKIADLSKSINDLDEKRNLYNARKKQLQEMLSAENFRQIKQERDALHTELAAAGVFKRKKSNKEAEPEPEASGVVDAGKRRCLVSITIGGVIETDAETDAIETSNLAGLPTELEMRKDNESLGTLTDLDVKSISVDDIGEDE